MRGIFLFFSILFCSGLWAQENFSEVETLPLMYGCEEYEFDNKKNRECFQRELVQYVAENFEYPKDARFWGVQGRVFISFVIEKDGSVSEIEVVRSAARNYKLRFWLRRYARRIDEEGKRVGSMLSFKKPAYADGEPVRMSFTLPINAKLE